MDEQTSAIHLLGQGYADAVCQGGMSLCADFSIESEQGMALFWTMVLGGVVGCMTAQIGPELTSYAIERLKGMPEELVRADQANKPALRLVVAGDGAPGVADV